MAKKNIFACLQKLDFTKAGNGFKALLIGVLVAIIIGLIAGSTGMTAKWIYVLLVLGVVAGILNIFHKEAVLLLIAGLTITVMLGVLAGLAVMPAWLAGTLNAVIYILAPATVIVGLKVLYALACK